MGVMGVKRLAALAAAITMCAPALASDFGKPFSASSSTLFYVSIPLDAHSRKEQRPAFGLALQGQRPYESVRIDSRMFRFLPLGGMEVKWLVVGGVAVAAAVAAGSKDREREQQYQVQQQQQIQQQQEQQQKQEPCPRIC